MFLNDTGKSYFFINIFIPASNNLTIHKLLFPGYYLYIEASSPRRQGDLARISTPQYQATTGSMCLQFWYHMWGQNMGSLQIFVQDSSGKKSIWKRSGNQVNLWLYNTATFTPNAAYKVSTYSIYPKICRQAWQIVYTQIRSHGMWILSGYTLFTTHLVVLYSLTGCNMDLLKF